MFRKSWIYIPILQIKPAPSIGLAGGVLPYLVSDFFFFVLPCFFKALYPLFLLTRNFVKYSISFCHSLDTKYIIYVLYYTI